jgi:hypothetical protein
MKSCTWILALAIVAGGTAAPAAIVTDVILGGEALVVDEIIGSGANTAYVVIDFAGERYGGELADTGPQNVYAFGFRYDDPVGPPLLTLGDMLDALDTAGEVGVTTSGLLTNAGGRTLGGLMVGLDELELVPGFAGDSFWATFLYDQNGDAWAFANTGIDSRTFAAPSMQQPTGDTILANQNVYGLISDVFTNSTLPLPRIPAIAIAVPEPSTFLLLAAIGVTSIAARRRRLRR